MLTRVALQGIKGPRLIPETPESDDLREENRRLRRHINRLSAELYEFQRTVKGYLDGLNNKGVLSISQATIDASTLGTCNLQGTCYATGFDWYQSTTLAWNQRSTSDNLEFYSYLGTTGVKHSMRPNSYRIHDSKTPASAVATGAKGEICYDASYLYVCTATDTWTRLALAW